MTPTEKAKELIEKYCQVIFGDEKIVNISKPKECSLISVSECFGVCARKDDDSGMAFWELTKREIEKL